MLDFILGRLYCDNYSQISLQFNQLQDRVNLAYAPRNAARVNAKCTMKVNGCNLLQIDFLLPLSRGAVCQVQSPAVHRR